jgi:hypothetical protein
LPFCRFTLEIYTFLETQGSENYRKECCTLDSHLPKK